MTLTASCTKIKRKQVLDDQSLSDSYVVWLFQEFLGRDKIYSHANFYCYASLPVILGQIQGKKISVGEGGNQLSCPVEKKPGVPGRSTALILLWLFAISPFLELSWHNNRSSYAVDDHVTHAGNYVFLLISQSVPISEK